LAKLAAALAEVVVTSIETCALAEIGPLAIDVQL
jgi:hypothetical protein